MAPYMPAMLSPEESNKDDVHQIQSKIPGKSRLQ